MKNPKVWITIGAPGCGKSTWAKKLVEGDEHCVALVCPDTFRALFGTGEGDQSVSHRAFEASFDALRKYLMEGKSVVVDATNMYRKTRKKFIEIAKGFGAETEAVVFEVDKATLLERNRKRGANGGRDVPEFVIDNMLGKYQRPDETEFDKVTFVCKLTP